MKKQKAIYMAWLKLFSKYWPKKVSIDSIIDEAKVWKWTFYKYFKNKTDFYEKIVDDMLMDKWWEEEFWLLSKEEMLVSHMVWILFYLEKNDILNNMPASQPKNIFNMLNKEEFMDVSGLSRMGYNENYLIGQRGNQFIMYKFGSDELRIYATEIELHQDLQAMQQNIQMHPVAYFK